MDRGVRNEGNRFIPDCTCEYAGSSSTRFCRPKEVNELLSSLNKGMKPVEVDRGGSMLGGRVGVTSMMTL
jgi:hypothetical protein